MTQVLDCQPASVRFATTSEFAAVKARQRATWASGDFSIIGTTLQIVGEALCEAADLRAGSRVLDVACGNGNASLAAAHRFCDVTGLDYVPALLEDARRRAAAEKLQIRFVEGDAEHLPFADGEFDAVLSTYGVMFAPDHPRAAFELSRVCRPGGKIALACWTPSGVIGQLLKTVGGYVPPPPGVSSPALWGDRDHLASLFGTRTRDVQVTNKHFNLRYTSPAHFVSVFRDFYGPVHKAFSALEPEKQTALAADIEALLRKFNVAGEASLVVPAEYLEIVLQRVEG